MTQHLVDLGVEYRIIEVRVNWANLPTLTGFSSRALKEGHRFDPGCGHRRQFLQAIAAIRYSGIDDRRVRIEAECGFSHFLVRSTEPVPTGNAGIRWTNRR